MKFEKTFSLKDILRYYIDMLNHEMMVALSKIDIKSIYINSEYILDQPISIRTSDCIENEIWLLAISPFKINQ